MYLFHRFVFLCVLLPSLSSAHELWIEPQSWQVAAGDEIIADLRNGEEFSGAALAWFDRSVARAEFAIGNEKVTYSARLGDRPALVAPAFASGLAVLVHETTPSRITYKTWEKFEKFDAHKDLGVEKAAHLAAGHPESDFTEAYTRHAKSLVAVGDGAGSDSAFGLETEFVALTNPYAAGFDGQMRVLLTYQNAPRANVQIEVFDRAPDGEVDVRLARTDGGGRATIPVTPGHVYLFDSVVLRPGTEEGAVYDTLWAALTFYVPKP